MTKSVEQMQVKKIIERSEVAIQFEQIFQDHHDPIKKQSRIILDNRAKRADIIKQDAGL